MFKHRLPQWCALLIALATSFPSFALSRSIGRDIEFPKGYDAAKAQAILAVVRDERFQFVDGLVSYWPPDWAIRLSYTGNAPSLTAFLDRIRALPGIGLRVMIYHGRNDESRRDSAWQLEFSHARPDELTVWINVDSEEFASERIELPRWSPSAPPNSRQP